MWTPFIGPNEGYSGYEVVRDTIHWQIVNFNDGIPRDHNFASAVQYRPPYGGDGNYYGIYDDCIRVGQPDPVTIAADWCRTLSRLGQQAGCNQSGRRGPATSSGNSSYRVIKKGRHFRRPSDKLAAKAAQATFPFLQ